MSTLLEYQLRIRNAADSADALVVTSVRGGTNPYIVDPPTVDGSEFDPLTGSYRSGTATVRIADAITSGTSRVVTSQLEDASFRQQLPGRKAYVEERENGGSWNTVQAGIVTGLRLASGAVWEVDVGDTTMAGRNLAAFAPKRRVSDATKLELFSDYLTRWPNRGCLAGGPVIGGFLGMADLNGWEMTVANSASIFAGKVKLLSFNAGYTWPTFKRTTKADDVAQTLNDAVGEASGLSDASFKDDMPGQSGWRDVVVQVIGTGYYTVAKIGGYTNIGGSSAMLNDTPFFDNGNFGHGIHVNDPSLTLTVGTKVRVRVFDALPSERCPIYYRGHPVDLATKLCDEAGIAYDATQATAAKQALGAALTITVRITGSQSWSSFTESVLYGPCGFSARTLPSGALAFFTTRIMASSLPGVTITTADVPQGETVLFDLSEPDAITKVTYNQQNLIPAVGTVPGSQVGTAVPRTAVSTTTRTAQQRITNPPLDGVSVQTVTVERTSGDTAAAVQKEQAYTIPGFLDTGSLRYEPQLVDAKAAEIFDRDGRGRITGEVQLLRSGAGGAVVLGQEIIVAVPQMPNHNKRYLDDNTVGGRCVQILRLSKGPRGPMARFKDSGPNAQPLTTLPTLSLAAGPTGNTVALTITNAATLNAAGYAVRIQWALASSAPASTDYSQVAYYPAGGVPTTAIVLPTVPGGLTAYVQARSEAGDHRPSAWTSATSLASVAMGAPTGISVTPNGSDGSRATVAWTTGTNAGGALVDIFTRLSSLTPADNVRMAAGLLAGTISYPLTELVPGLSYIVTVQHRDSVTGATTSATFTFTAGSTTRTLSAPTNPVGIVGSTDPATGVGRIDGTYGLNVNAAELPGFVTFWEAIETGIGAGTYGSFTQVSGMVPSVSGGPTIWRGTSANALLRKQLKARHEALGTTPSTYTAAVTLDAWGVVASPPPAATTADLIAPPTALVTLVSEDDTQVVLATSGTVGQNGAGPLQYAWRTGAAGFSAYSTTHANQTITKLPKLTQNFELKVKQADGQESAPVSYPVTGANTGVNAGTGQVDPGVQLSGIARYIPRATDVNGWILDTNTKDNRSRLLNTGFQYGTDTSAGVVETAGQKFVNGAALDGSRNVDFGASGVVNRLAANVNRIAGGASVQAIIQQLTDVGHAGSAMQDSRAALLNGMFRYGTDSSNGVVDGTGSPITGGKRGFSTIDASNRVYRANGFDDGYYAIASTNSAGTALHGSVADSRAALVNAMFRASVDTLSSVLNDGTWRKVAASQVDTSGIITNAGTAPTITAPYAYNADYPGDGGGGFDVSWSSNNLPAGCTYDIVGTITAGNTTGSTAFSSLGNTSSPVHISHALGSSAPSCKLTITAKQDGVTICVGVLGDTAIAF